MTVKELINELKKYDENMKVFVPYYDEFNDKKEVTNVYKDLICNYQTGEKIEDIIEINY